MRRIFIDANIFIYILTADPRYSDKCFQLLEGVEEGKIMAFISTLIVNEVSHVLMVLRATELVGASDLGAVFRTLPDVKKDCQQKVRVFYQYLDYLISLGSLKVEPIDYTIACASIEYAERFGLLPSDAVHVACCCRLGIEEMATNDGDFEAVEFLRLWKPI